MVSLVSLYGLTYLLACGVLLGVCIGRRSYLSVQLTRLDMLNLLVWIAVWTIVGGRLGYVVGYEFSYYLENPLEIVQLYKGGMSFHGALLCCIIATLGLSYCHVRRCGLRQANKQTSIYNHHFTYRHHHLTCNQPSMGKKNLLKDTWSLSGWLFDCLSVCALIMLPVGRVCNFFNGEAFGRVTDVPWAVIFLNVDINPRHPSQLYEALAEGPVLWALLSLYRRIQGRWRFQGEMALGFIVGYGVLRFLVEFTREADFSVGYLGGALGLELTLGQVLCMVQVGVALSMWYCLLRLHHELS